MFLFHRLVRLVLKSSDWILYNEPVELMTVLLRFSSGQLKCMKTTFSSGQLRAGDSRILQILLVIVTHLLLLVWALEAEVPNLRRLDLKRVLDDLAGWCTQLHTAWHRTQGWGPHVQSVLVIRDQGGAHLHRGGAEYVTRYLGHSWCADVHGTLYILSHARALQ